MKRDTRLLLLLGLLLLAGLVWSAFLVVWAIDCGNAGGAFIAPQNSLPVCVAGVPGA